MNERPILFSAPMVMAILAGQKTQTRRIIKPQPNAAGLWPRGTPPGDGPRDCPHGPVGDRLWVREAYRLVVGYDGWAPRAVPAGVPVRHESDGLGAEQTDGWLWGKRRQGMFMCRWMSRITLEVTGVRVQRLHDISEADTQAEGITDEQIDQTLMVAESMNQREPRPARWAYRTLWENINGSGSWDANPWVWVVEFRRC